ncbi:MAG: autotransporter-associated beta strand repeat-containing protein, partial [Verrucomicrobiota bacterium]
NITNSGVDLNGTAQAFGSLAGNLNFNNHNGALILGANNLSTLYTGRFNTGTGSITKIGTGTQTFSGANLYTGATNINGGTLLIGNGLEISNPAASLGTSNVTVGNGVLTGTLGGNGRVNGAVTVTSTGHLAPAMTPSTSNTLTLGNNLTLNAGATLDFNFGSAGTGGAGSSDRVNVGGNLLLNAGADVLNITQLPNFGIGTYTLFTVANGSFTNNATFTINGNTNFNYAILRPGDLIDPAANGGITGATVPAKQLWLQVLQGNPNLTWLGGINGSWDINTTANWGGASTRFSNGANLTFDDTATGPATLTVAAGGVSQTFSRSVRMAL